MFTHFIFSLQLWRTKLMHSMLQGLLQQERCST